MIIHQILIREATIKSNLLIKAGNKSVIMEEAPHTRTNEDSTSEDDYLQ